MEWTDWIGVAAGLAGIAFGFLTWRRASRGEEATAGRRDGMVLTELGYIKSGVDDIKRKQERQEEQNMQVAARLAAVEERTRQAHKHIDELTHS